MSNPAFDISVIIVSHNSSDAISACLEALKVPEVSRGFQLIIVDNGSSDGTIETVRRTAPDAHVIEVGKNIGFGAACNRGAEAAEGKYLLFLNPDARPDPDCFGNLVRAAEGNSKAGFVVPRLRFPDGRFQPSCRKLPTIGNMIFSRGSAFTKIFSKSGSEPNPYTLGDSREIMPVPAVAGTAALIRRELFTAFKGFDERFFLYMEDTDLCCRLGQSGYVHLFVPGAGAVHEWGSGSTTGKVVRLFRHHLSVWKYFLKHFPNGFSVVLLPLFLAANLLVSVVVAGLSGRGSK